MTEKDQKDQSKKWFVFFTFASLICLSFLVQRKIRLFAHAQDQHPMFYSMRAYRGDLHVHSSYSSDGPCALPSAVFDAGKARGNDFLALTDHDYDIKDSKVACSSTLEPNKWQKIKEAANNKNQDGTFVAFFGFEWTHSPNHINIINSSKNDAPYSVSAFFDWIGRQPDKQNIIAQFNHPILTDVANFPFRQDLIPIFRTIETNAFSPAYNPFLKKGWKVGAVGYGDSHDINLMGGATYGVWAESLTKQKILEAILKRRTFSAKEPAPTILPTISTALIANGIWMGETVNASSFYFQIFASDPARNITKIELVGGNPYTGGTGYHLLKSFYSNAHQANLTYTFTPTDPKYYKFYYLKVYELNNNGQEYLSSLTSPIFVEYNPNTAGPSPTNPSAPTITPTPMLLPSVTPALTITTTPPVQLCTQLGSSFKDQSSYSTSTAQALTIDWGVGEALKFSPSKKGKIDKVKLYLSWKTSSRIRVKITDLSGKSLSEEKILALPGTSTGSWKEFDFTSEPLVQTTNQYIITFREDWGNVYVHRGSYWSWAFEEYLKPCLN